MSLSLDAKFKARFFVEIVFVDLLSVTHSLTHNDRSITIIFQWKGLHINGTFIDDTK